MQCDLIFLLTSFVKYIITYHELQTGEKIIFFNKKNAAVLISGLRVLFKPGLVTLPRFTILFSYKEIH